LTEYQDERIHVISEFTCTLKEREGFKNHILSYCEEPGCLV